MAHVSLTCLQGTHYEMGLKQGQVIQTQIHSLLEDLPNSQAFKLMKPRFIPSSIFLFLAKRRATSLLLDDITKYQPLQTQRLRGIAEGAKIDLQTALFIQSLELLIGSPSYTTQACSALAFAPNRTKAGEVIVAKNFDYLKDLTDYQLTCESNPEVRYRTLGSTVATLPGMLDGMNEHGLTVTYNLAFTTDKPSNYVPVSMAIQDMLETCRSTDEAISYFKHAKRGGHDAVLTIVDSEGDIRSVELSSNHMGIRVVDDGLMLNTNHYHVESMREYEVPWDAVYSGGNVPKEFVGQRVHESSERRYNRVLEMLEGETKISEEKIISVLRDHGGGSPSNLTICQHGSITSTIRSMIFYPHSRIIKVLYGNACENEYTVLSFSDTK
jgi:predicted choloylglycine hydrolase